MRVIAIEMPIIDVAHARRPGSDFKEAVGIGGIAHLDASHVVGIGQGQLPRHLRT